jgi:hypothetical protein
MPIPNRPAELVRINVIVSPAERDAFDKWCRYGGTRLSMTARLRQLMHADAAGKIAVPRDAPPVGKQAKPQPPASRGKR